MRRDTRRFVCFRWRLLEAPASNPLNLVRAWKERYGYLPPFGFGAVSGWHFLLADGGRGVRIERPDRLSLSEPIRAQLFTAIAAKHQAAGARFAKSAETPDLKTPDRLPRREDLDQIEEWPSDRVLDEPVVAELALSQGLYLTEPAWGSNADILDRALTFADPVEAEHHLQTLTPRPSVVLRYRAAAQSEADLNEAQQIDGKPSL